jgi:hypothetical protein
MGETRPTKPSARNVPVFGMMALFGRQGDLRSQDPAFAEKFDGCATTGAAGSIGFAE